MGVKSLLGGVKLSISEAVIKQKEIEEVSAEETQKVLRKEARKALVDAGVWRQEFHGSELVAIIAMFKAISKAGKK